MATAIQNMGTTGSRLPSPIAEQSRGRILAAAAEILRNEPESFSLQRVARRAGISPRAIYGHFESGAELAQVARLSALNAIVETLPPSVEGERPEAAVLQFASAVAASLQAYGSVWLLLGRQDPGFRLQYRRSVRLQLIRELNSYLIMLRPNGDMADMSNSRLAELLVTAIESIVVNFDEDLALELDCEEAIDQVVRAILQAHL